MMVQQIKTRGFGKNLWPLVWLNLIVGLVLALTFWVIQNRTHPHSFTDELISSFIHTVIYGLTLSLLVPYLGERLIILRAPWNWAAIIASLLFIAFASTLLVEVILMSAGYLSRAAFRQEFVGKSLGVFSIVLVIGLCIHAYETLRDRWQATNLQLRTHELEKERALKLLTEVRLASLQSRVHPHFLFNALNSISALISENPPQAEQMVQRLASLLRTSLDAFENDESLLNDEIELVTDYLEIEKVRFGERLRYSVEVPSELGSVRVPPLILQPIVENSVKFSVSPRPSGGEIRVAAERREKHLVLHVWDNGPGFAEESVPDGHGLDNLRSRLVALYGEEAKLSIDSRDGETNIRVYLPVDGFATN